MSVRCGRAALSAASSRWPEWRDDDSDADGEEARIAAQMREAAGLAGGDDDAHTDDDDDDEHQPQPQQPAAVAAPVASPLASAAATATASPATSVHGASRRASTTSVHSHSQSQSHSSGPGSVSLALKQQQRTSRVAEGSGLLVMDSLQIERLKLHFRSGDTGRFDRALELPQFVEAFAAVLPGKTRKEFKQIFMKIDADANGSVDWNEFTNFMLSSEDSGESGETGGPDGGSGAGQPAQGVRGGSGTITFVRNHRYDRAEHPHSFIPRTGEHGGAAAHTQSGSLPSAATAAPSSSSSSSLLVPSRKSTFHSGMISKLLYLAPYDRFVSGARDGLLKFWSGPDLSHVRTVRHANCWITDVCYMRKSNRVAVCSMDRQITFYDPATFEPVSRIRDVGASRPLVSAPTCMDAATLAEEEVLLIGDDTGNLLVYRMKSTAWHICDGRGGIASCRHHEEHTAKNYSTDVTVARLVALHADWITSVRYDSRLGMVITSSLDRTVKQCDINKMTDAAAAGAAGSGLASGSGVGGGMGGGGGGSGGLDGSGTFDGSGMGGGSSPGGGMEEIVRRTFTGHSKGVYSFDYSKKYKFMASAGLEREILLWDPFTLQHISSLSGHAASVAQVLVCDEQSLLLSLDFLKNIKVWSLKQDANNLRCVQTLCDISPHSLFAGAPAASPSSSVGLAGVHHGGGGGGGGARLRSSYRPENRIGFMHLDLQHGGGRLLCCSSKLLVWSLRTMRDGEGGGPRSHAHALVGAVYIPTFNQVVSGDARGLVRVWDVDTGLPVFSFDTHCGARGAGLNCVAFDTCKRRLLTGATDGRMQMWNFSNGQAIMEFDASKFAQPALSAPSNSGAVSGALSARKKASGAIGGGGVGGSGSGGDNEITSIEYITLEKAQSTSKYVLATGRDRKVTVYLEADGKQDAVFTLPPSQPNVATPAPTPSAAAPAARVLAGPKVATPMAAAAQKRATAVAAAAAAASVTTTATAAGATPSPAPKESAHFSLSPKPSKEALGHRDDILCICVCGKPGAGGATIATGSYDGICLWHFDSQNLFAKLVPPASSTNQAMRRRAERARQRHAAQAQAQAQGHARTASGDVAMAAGAPGHNHRKSVSFAVGNDAEASTSRAFSFAIGADDGDDLDESGFERYTPASNAWESLTPLVERACEKLAWVVRLGVLVSAGADGIVRFWDVRNARMICDRPARMGFCRSENVLALKVVETVASNWAERHALQRHMDPQGQLSLHRRNSSVAAGGSGDMGAAGAAAAAVAAAAATASSGPDSAGAGVGAASVAASDDVAVAAINAIDSKPAVHYTFLLTGDSKGHVMIFDMSDFAFEFRRDAAAAAAAAEAEAEAAAAAGVPADVLSVGGSGGAAAASLRKSMLSPTSGSVRPVKLHDVPVLSLPLSSAVVALTHWQAHAASAITCLDYLTSYKLVLTGSADGRLLLWTRCGALVGMFGQSQSAAATLDGCWDLHDAATFRTTSPPPFDNQSVSDTEGIAHSEDDDEAESAAGSARDTDEEEQHSSSDESASASLSSKPKSKSASASASGTQRRRRSRRRGRRVARLSALAELYPSPSASPARRLYDESPPHTPIEDEGRSRSNTPERLEEAARAAALAAKNRMSTVDSLAALGLAALRFKENARRKAAGMPSVEEEESAKNGPPPEALAEEEKAAAVAAAAAAAAATAGARTVPGTGTITPAGAGMRTPRHAGSVATSRRSSVVNSMGMVIGGGGVSKPSSCVGSPLGGGLRKLLLQQQNDPNAPKLLSRSSLVLQLASSREEKQAPPAGSKSASGVPSLALHGVAHHASGALYTAPSSSSSLSGGGRSARHRGAGAHHSSSSSSRGVVVVPNMPSSLVPLMSSRESWEYFQATVFNKSSSSRHPTHNVPPPRMQPLPPGVAPSPQAMLVASLVAREAALADRVESDEDADDWYSNEGGHASSFYRSARGSSALHASSGSGAHGSGGGGGQRGDDLEARRQRLTLGALKLDPSHEDGERVAEADPDAADDADYRAGGSGSGGLLGGGGGGDKGGAGSKKTALLSVRARGVTAANIRRRLASPLSSLALPTASTLAASKFSSRARSLRLATGASDAKLDGPDHAQRRDRRSSVRVLRDYPIVEVPYDNRGRDDALDQDQV